MQPEDNLIKPSQPAGSQPLSYELPITVGHQAVLDKPVMPDNDGATSIPVTVNRSFSPVPAPNSATHPDISEPPEPAAPLPTVSAQPHPQQAKIDAHPLFQKEGYNSAPPTAGFSASAAPLPLPKRRRSRKLLWMVLIIIALLGSYAAVDALTDVKLPYEFFKKVVPAAKISADPYEGWKTYDDDFLSFKYPASWMAKRDDNTSLPGTKSLKLTGPEDTSVAASSAVPVGQKAAIVLTVFRTVDAACKCKVYDILPLSMSAYPQAKLAVTSDTRLGGDPTTPAANLVVTDDNTAVTGVVTLKNGLTVGKDNVGIWAVITGDDVPDYTISNLSGFEESQSVQDLRKIINTVIFH